MASVLYQIFLPQGLSCEKVKETIQFLIGIKIDNDASLPAALLDIHFGS